MPTHITSAGLIIAPDPAELFTYPHHIDRASLDALPAKPGIYIFRDARDLPLYVGKSINIRSRVLSHMRTPDEARMLQQTRYVEFRRTAGDIGALLLESRLIKEMQPVFNQQLRRTRDMCTLLLIDQKPAIFHGRELDFASTQGLYGLFATRRAALEKLRNLVHEHRLCAALTGLEKTARGRPCFARQIARCLGACTGDESAHDHFARLHAALEELRIVVWPYPGPVGIVEECDGWQQMHVVDHWFYIGSIDHDRNNRKKYKEKLQRPAKRAFDVDSYSILVKPMLDGRLTIVSRVGATIFASG